MYGFHQTYWSQQYSDSSHFDIRVIVLKKLPVDKLLLLMFTTHVGKSHTLRKNLSRTHRLTSRIYSSLLFYPCTWCISWKFGCQSFKALKYDGQFEFKHRKTILMQVFTQMKTFDAALWAYILVAANFSSIIQEFSSIIAGFTRFAVRSTQSY